jgi:hydroxymethylglutaryl-CoA reductase
MAVGSRIPGFYRLSVGERLAALLERGVLSQETYDILVHGQQVLETSQADRLIENVIGVFGLPMGLGLNFLVNDRDYLIPMVVEEPSIVAAVSSAAKMVREAGGFRTESSDPLLIGQIQVVNVARTADARHAVLEHKREILDLANSLHPNMIARGGGAREVEVNVHPATSTSPEMFIVHLLIDTRDAMGANLINSMCEEVAPLIEKLTGGKVFLRILSNLASGAMVKAEATIPVDLLADAQYSGEDVRDGIVLANQFAELDPYRAATHNKGVMNGIDAVALATGNDWRAIEASAHAYAALHGRYRSLTRWWKTPEGGLAGTLELPLKVGTIGSQIQSNPAARVAHQILGIRSARLLAEVMCAVGLAQNLAALRALSTDGIQRGHMALHARSVAVAAGTPPSYFEDVVERLIESGEVKVWKAKDILEQLGAEMAATDAQRGAKKLTAADGVGHGKIILLGEHAVVYGSHALAAPLELAMQTSIEDLSSGLQIIIPQWNVTENMDLGVPPRNSLEKSLLLIIQEMGVAGHPISIRINSHVPRAMGLGGSAALAVSVIRALARHFRIDLTEDEVNRLAFKAEQNAHGVASGIDNSVATYGRPILFRRGEPPEIRPVTVGAPATIVVGLSRQEGLTAAMVAKVAQAREVSRAAYDRVFDQIDALTLQATDALQVGNLDDLGRCMNLCHGLLNALQVSTREIEELVEIARTHGALGAKLTGAGGGGAMIALAPENPERVARAMRSAGYRAFLTGLSQTAEAGEA